MFFYYVVERALITIMCVFNVRKIKWNCTDFFRLGYDIIKWYINDFCIRVNKSFDEPWTGYTIDLWALTSYPLHWANIQNAFPADSRGLNTRRFTRKNLRKSACLLICVDPREMHSILF